MQKEPSTLVFFNETYSALIGKVMEIIECLNLPERQDSAIKAQIKKEFYYMRDELAFKMTDEQFSSVFKLKLKE